MAGSLTTEPPGWHSVALAANERYFPGLYCAIASLLAHATARSLRIYVLDGGLLDDSRTLLDELAKRYHGRVELRYERLTLDRFSGLPLGPGRSLMTYARLVLPDLLPRENRVLFLDADLLVFADVASLCNHVLADGMLLAAVADAEIRSTAQDAPRVAAALGQGPGRGYFNAGVMVMDLRRMRECGFTAKAMDFLAKHGGCCRFHDQSAINFLFIERIEQLPRVWNTPAWMFDQTRWEARPPERILHFTNEAPWLKDSGGACNALFRRYAAAMGVPVNEQTRDFEMSRKLARRKDAEAPLRAAAYGVMAVLCLVPGLQTKRAGYAAAAGHWWRRWTGQGKRRALQATNLETMKRWFQEGWPAAGGAPSRGRE